MSRRILKPLIWRLLGPKAYEWFHMRAKIRDIEKRLVEEPEMATLPWFVKSGDHVIDIGANFGYYTSRLSNLCREGRVHAFEPIPSTFHTLTGIVKRLRLKNVDLHRLGVGERAGEVSFEVPLQETGTPSAGQAHISGRDNSIEGNLSHYAFKEKIQVPCQIVALDSTEWRRQIPRVSFVKMDIEGAEYFALKGMAKMLAQDKPVVLLEICPYFLAGFQISAGSLRDLICGLGYRTFSYRPQTGRLLEIGSSEYEDGNYILLPETRIGEFSDRIQPAEGR